MKAAFHLRRSQRGIAIVEFTIALPVLLLLLAATAEIGRMLSHYDTLNKAVRDGARYLAANALLGTTGVVSINSTVQTATVNLVVTGNTAGTSSALLPNLTTGNVTVTGLANGYVSVSAAYTYVPMLGAQISTFGFTAPINTAVTMNATVVMKPL
jgi:Flp pilus assembly protein TadG